MGNFVTTNEPEAQGTGSRCKKGDWKPRGPGTCNVVDAVLGVDWQVWQSVATSSRCTQGMCGGFGARGLAAWFHRDAGCRGADQAKS